MKLTFGKYKDVELKDIPDHYIIWFKENVSSFDFPRMYGEKHVQFKKELEDRYCECVENRDDKFRQGQIDFIKRFCKSQHIGEEKSKVEISGEVIQSFWVDSKGFHLTKIATDDNDVVLMFKQLEVKSVNEYDIESVDKYSEVGDKVKFTATVKAHIYNRARPGLNSLLTDALEKVKVTIVNRPRNIEIKKKKK